MDHTTQLQQATIPAFCCKCGCYVTDYSGTVPPSSIKWTCRRCSDLENDSMLARGGYIDQHGIIHLEEN